MLKYAHVGYFTLSNLNIRHFVNSQNIIYFNIWNMSNIYSYDDNMMTFSLVCLFLFFSPTVSLILCFCWGLLFFFKFTTKVLQQWANRLIHIKTPLCFRDGTLPTVFSPLGSSPIMLQAGWIGNLVLRLPRITMMEGIWAVVCQAYEILSIHPGRCQAFLTTVMFSIWVWRAELKPTNPLFIVCMCVYAHVCVCGKQTNG